MCQQGSTKHNVSSPTAGNISILIAAIAPEANALRLLKVSSRDSANASVIGVMRGESSSSGLI